MMVSSELAPEIEEFLARHNIQYHTMIEDVERYIQHWQSRPGFGLTRE